jgi:hypothetical protein
VTFGNHLVSNYGLADMRQTGGSSIFPQKMAAIKQQKVESHILCLDVLLDIMIELAEINDSIELLINMI